MKGLWKWFLAPAVIVAGLVLLGANPAEAHPWRRHARFVYPRYHRVIPPVVYGPRVRVTVPGVHVRVGPGVGVYTGPAYGYPAYGYPAYGYPVYGGYYWGW